MESIRTLKRRAKTSLKDNWGEALVYTFLAMLTSGCISYFFSSIDPILHTDYRYDGVSVIGASQIVGWFIAFPISWGLSIGFLNLTRGHKLEMGTIFAGYKDFWRIGGTGMLMYIYTILWSLLFIIPGFIKYYSYSMTSFILKDEPEMGFNKAIERSMELMKGNKLRLFLLDLSMIGWFLLCGLTLGLGLLCLIPYNQSAHAQFYRDLINEREAA